MRTVTMEDGDFDQGQRSNEPETNLETELGDRLARLRFETEEREAGMMEREARPLRGTTLPEGRGRSSTSSTRSLMRTTEPGPASGPRPLRGRGALSRGAGRVSTGNEGSEPARNRLDEMTPGRTITFEDTFYSDPEGEDGDLPDTSQMSMLALQRALRAEQIRRAQLERAMRRQSSPRRRSTYTENSEREEGCSHACPKLNKPRTFRGKYTEVYNVLNWLHQVLRYLMQCHCDPNDYTGYAHTYMRDSPELDGRRICRR